MKHFVFLIFLLGQLFFTKHLFAQNYLPVSGEEHNAVARVVLTDQNGERFLGFCSGVLVAPKVVLSARHCLEFTKIPLVILGTRGDFEQIEVDRVWTTDMPKRIANMFQAIGELSRDYSTNRQEMIGKDLLVIFLKESSKFEPIPFIPETLQPFLGEAPLQVVGFPGVAS